jgi:sugar O-acyltransferase (sialic acid O-acetyltransferase NeuD family)
LNEIVVVGASGYGREVFQYVKDAAQHDPNIRAKGLLDDDTALRGQVGGHDIIGDTHTYAVQEDDRFVISAGSPLARQTLAERLAGRGGRFFTLIHPTAYVAPTARMGVGCIVSPYASIGSNAHVEDHVLLVMYASVAHDCRVGRFCSLSPYSAVAGGGILETRVFIGSHAFVTPMRNVGRDSKIAAGAVVYRDVPERSLATGNPAKILPLS